MAVIFIIKLAWVSDKQAKTFSLICEDIWFQSRKNRPLRYRQQAKPKPMFESNISANTNIIKQNGLSIIIRSLDLFNSRDKNSCRKSVDKIGLKEPAKSEAPE